MFDWEIDSFAEIYSITIWLAPRLIDASARSLVDIAGTLGTRGQRAAAHRMKWGVVPETDVKRDKRKKKSKLKEKKGKPKKKGKLKKGKLKKKKG